MENFKIVYTNCDFRLLNKKDELNSLLENEKPCVVGLTEIIQKKKMMQMFQSMNT